MFNCASWVIIAEKVIYDIRMQICMFRNVGLNCITVKEKTGLFVFLPSPATK